MLQPVYALLPPPFSPTGVPDLSPEMQSLLLTQHARLQRALTRLAADLYSSRSHLLLELLQNADDCVYPEPSGAGPQEEVGVGAWCVCVCGKCTMTRAIMSA